MELMADLMCTLVSRITSDSICAQHVRYMLPHIDTHCMDKKYTQFASILYKLAILHDFVLSCALKIIFGISSRYEMLFRCWFVWLLGVIDVY